MTDLPRAHEQHVDRKYRKQRSKERCDACGRVQCKASQFDRSAFKLPIEIAAEARADSIRIAAGHACTELHRLIAAELADAHGGAKEPVE